MILRRLAEGVRQQDWFTVVLEVLIVVVGIFLGLQVDDWNEARKDRLEESAYLARLVDDLNESIIQTQHDIDFMEGHAASGARALDALEACHLPEESQSDFVTGLYQVGKVSPVHLVRNTIDELRSTGKLAIIGNAALRRQLNETVQWYEDSRDILDDIRGRLAPPVNYVDSQVAFKIRSAVGGGAALEWQDISMDFEALCKDRRFYTAVATGVNYTWDVIARNRQILGRLEQLRTKVQVELANFSRGAP